MRNIRGEGRVRMMRNAELLRNTRKVGRVEKIKMKEWGGAGAAVDASPPSYIYQRQTSAKIER